MVFWNFIANFVANLHKMENAFLSGNRWVNCAHIVFCRLTL